MTHAEERKALHDTGGRKLSEPGNAIKRKRVVRVSRKKKMLSRREHFPVISDVSLEKNACPGRDSNPQDPKVGGF
jgi:hypothetical protein